MISIYFSQFRKLKRSSSRCWPVWFLLRVPGWLVDGHLTPDSAETVFCSLFFVIF